MKLLFFLMAILATTNSCTERKKNRSKYSDLRTENIKGDVRYMQMTSYDCDSMGKILEMQDCCTTLFEYNEDGNLLKQVSTNKEGKITEEETTTIHENGLRTSLTTIRNGRKARYMVFTVNDSGRYDSGKVFDSADRVQMYYEDFVMNEYGQPVSFTMYGNDSSVIMKEQAKYSGNKLLSYFQTDKDGNQKASFTNKHNDKGELIEETAVEMTDTGTNRRVTKHSYNEYDENGNWTKTTRWNERGKAIGILKREFTYRK